MDISLDCDGICIGQKMALIETKVFCINQITIIRLIQDFTLELVPGAVLEEQSSITLKLKYGLPLIVAHRKIENI
jgi:hypothetical protein